MSLMKILFLQLLSPQLWIKSRRAPEPEGFVEHSSKVNHAAEKPFFITWQNGDVQHLYMDQNESASSANLKRGLASLFQYRTLDDEVHQRDASGSCDVIYTTFSKENVIEKQKIRCTQKSLPPPKRHPNPVFAVKLESHRNSTYVLSQMLLPKHVIDSETHKMTLATKSDIGTGVMSTRTLQHVQDLNTNVIKAESVKHAIALLQPGYKETDIELQPESVTCSDAGCPTVIFMIIFYVSCSNRIIIDNRVDIDNYTIR